MRLARFKKSIAPACLTMVYLIPFGFLAWFVASFSINVPNGDQWAMVAVFDNVAKGTATFNDFFGQHADHRILFPKLIFTLLAFLSRWNTQLEMATSLFLALLTFLGLDRIAQLTNPNDRSVPFWLVARFFTAVFIFSLAQFENWLWGFQLCFFLVQACVVGAIWALVNEKWSLRVRLTLACLLCAVSTFSLGNGFVAWAAILPLILTLPNGFKVVGRSILVWGTCAALSVAAYLTNYQPLPASKFFPDKLFFLSHPLEAAHFLITLIGSHFSHATEIDSFTIASLFGTLILIVFLSGVIYASKIYLLNRETNRDLIQSLRPWIALGLFGLLSAILITIGRSGVGVGFALITRYITSVNPLLIATLWITVILSRSQAQRYGLIFSAGILATFFVSTSAYAISQGQLYKTAEETGKTCLELIHYIDESTDSDPHSCLWSLFQASGDKAWIRKAATQLEALKFRAPITQARFTDQPSRRWGIFSTSADRMNPIASVRTGDILELSGWAYDRPNVNIPNAIAISQNEDRKFIAVTSVNFSQSERVERPNHRSYNRSKWSIRLPVELIQSRVELSRSQQPIAKPEAPSVEPSVTILKAWAYVTKGHRFVRLQEARGEMRIRIVQ